MATTMQLDLFEDSRDVMLNNAAVKALSTHDLGAAALAIRAQRDEFPRHHNLATHEQLFEQLNDFRRDLEPANLKSRHHQLIHGILPFAERLLGSALVIVWARPLWAELARAATPLVYDSDRRDTIFNAPALPSGLGSRNSTRRELTRLCSRNCVYWSTLSWSMPPPLCRRRPCWSPTRACARVSSATAPRWAPSNT